MLWLHPEATRELDATLGWYARRSPRAAAAFLKDVEHGLDQIQEAPERWPRLSARARRYLLVLFPFSLVYRIESG